MINNCQIEKKYRLLGLAILITLMSATHIQAAGASTPAVTSFCKTLTELLCDGTIQPLNQVIDELLASINKNPHEFVVILGSEAQLVALKTTLLTIKQRAQKGTISSLEIGKLLNQFVQYLPEETQAKLNTKSYFSLIKLGNRISQSLSLMKKA